MRLSSLRLALGVAVAGAILSCPVYAQQTKTQLNTYNNSNIKSNGTGAITGPILNAFNGYVISAMCGLAQASDCILPGGVMTTGIATTCASTGSGTGATCAVSTGSNATSGKMTITAGTSPSATGTVTLTLPSPVGTHSANCISQLSNGTGSWNGLGALVVSSDSTSAFTWNWSNNAVSLTAASTYSVAYHCIGN